MFLSLEEFSSYQPTKPTFAVFGSPIQHSLSPYLQTELAKKINLDITYLKVEVSKETLPTAVRIAREKLIGFNCTHPLKENILNFLDYYDEKTHILNACNTVFVDCGKLYGYNTDGYGIKNALSDYGISLQDAKALLLGCGGAASAFAYEAACANTHLTIAARNQEKALQFANRFPNLKYQIIPFDRISGQYDFVVNSTPIGMVSNADETPVDLSKIGTAFVYDMIYEPAMTKLLSDAEARGIPFDNGLSMLVYQGAESQMHWFGHQHSQEDQRAVLDALTAQKAKDHLGDRNIVLSGFMCAGKTTLGRALADVLGLTFLDTDKVLEEEFGCEISDFFARYGEAEFRKREAQTILRLSEKKNCVLALGGGAILNPDSAAALRKNGVVLFLNPPLETLMKRFHNDGLRPLLKQNNWKPLYQERLPIYQKTAHKSVRTQSPADLLKIIQGV